MRYLNKVVGKEDFLSFSQDLETTGPGSFTVGATRLTINFAATSADTNIFFALLCQYASAAAGCSVGTKIWHPGGIYCPMYTAEVYNAIGLDQVSGGYRIICDGVRHSQGVGTTVIVCTGVKWSVLQIRGPVS